jgi:hypothetical protein
MIASPAPKKASAMAALRKAGRRRSRIAAAIAALVAVIPSHQAGSIVGMK